MKNPIRNTILILCALALMIGGGVVLGGDLDHFCPAYNARGMALSEGYKPLTGGALVCVYGRAGELCPPLSVDGRVLVDVKVKPDGRVKCVYDGPQQTTTPAPTDPPKPTEARG